ncbi:MAG: site-2 protease family protein [Dehalococcoidia bacterium]|nr:site-2 protease family protein [Dehalococcoidia bacterium]
MTVNIIIIIFILSVVILIHELGHFLTARAAGVRVYEFGVGFPPRLFAFRRGDTEYSLNLIPLGGFVKMPDREDTSPGSLTSKSPWRRLAISAAGPIANIILAFVIFSIAFMIPVTVVTGGEGIKVAHVAPNSPAAEAGIREGDVILSVRGQPVESFTNIHNIIDDRLGLETEMTLMRGDSKISISLTPRVSPPEGEGPLGVELRWVTPHTVVHRNSFWKSITSSGSIIIHMPGMIRELLPSIIHNPGDTLRGPIGAAQITGEAIEYGVASVVALAGSISIGVALFNLLPVPPLDGAGMLLAIVELIRHGKRIPIRKEQLIYTLGTALLITLTVLIWYNDVLRLVRG